ncbi:hypothetical protein [Blastococcus sp. TF02A-35]|uniref:hypothetical protein n=1 Tax=Blastococcus sp. TF02A-35 TaxID=2559612 RepID=UPI0010731FF1|nr:hypothetical protein [Blastococcus sp. TF02A_35]
MAENGQVVRQFQAPDDDLAAFEAGIPMQGEHRKQVRAEGAVPGEYRLEKWVAGAWDFAGRYGALTADPPARGG